MNLWQEVFEGRLIEEIKSELDSASVISDRLYGGQERPELRRSFEEHLTIAQNRITAILQRLKE